MRTRAEQFDFDTLRQENAATHAETRRDFRETAGRVTAENRQYFEITVERLEKRFDMLAESVASVDEKLDRKTEELEERMERGFAETQAMIKFSHAELDRRVRALEQSQRTLEENLTGLQACVERLEESTH